MILLLFGAVGCGAQVSHTFTKAPPQTMTPRHPHDVEVLTVPPNDRRYVEVGYVEVEEQSRYSVKGRRELLALARHRAGQIGCEAIVFARADTVVGATLFNESAASLKGVQAACLIFPDGAPPSRRARTSARTRAPAQTDRCTAHRDAVKRAYPGAEQRDAVLALPHECR